MTTTPFRTLLLLSFGQAILAPIVVLMMAGGLYALPVSAILAMSWAVLMAYGFFKFKRGGAWFLLGAPLIGVWYVLFRIAWACAQNVNACP